MYNTVSNVLHDLFYVLLQLLVVAVIILSFKFYCKFFYCMFYFTCDRSVGGVRVQSVISPAPVSQLVGVDVTTTVYRDDTQV